jgi:hypothetical protein
MVATLMLRWRPKSSPFSHCELQRKEKGLRRALRCRRSPSGSADDRKSLRVDGVILISDSHPPAESFFDPAAAFRSFA